MLFKSIQYKVNKGQTILEFKLNVKNWRLVFYYQMLNCSFQCLNKLELCLIIILTYNNWIVL